MVEGGSTPYRIPYTHPFMYTCLHTNIHACLQTYMISVLWISIFLEFPHFHICRNMEIPEIQKSGHAEIMCLCMYVFLC